MIDLIRKFIVFTFKVMASVRKRVIFLYLLLFLFIFYSIDVKSVLHLSQLKVLNRLRPETVDFLVTMLDDDKPIDQDVLKQYSFYYKRVVSLLPQRADAWGLLAFCFYYEGEQSKAITSYNKAIELNPDFFWLYHNLGIIYYNSKDYSRAARYFKTAMEKDPKDILDYITSSIRIYMPLVMVQGIDSNKEFYDQAQEGYLRVVRLLTLSFYAQKDPVEMFKAANHAIITDLDHTGDFYFYAGVALYLANEFDKAVFYFQECLKRNDQNIEAYHYLGLTLNKRGEHDFAQVAFLKEKALSQTLSGQGHLLDHKRYNLQPY